MKDGLDFCGPRSYSIDSSSPFAKILTKDNATKVELLSQSRSDSGYQLVDIVIGLEKFASVTPITLSFVVNVKDRCADTKLILPSDLTEIPLLEFGYLDLEARYFSLPLIEDSIS